MSDSTPWPEPKFVCSLCGKPSGPGVPSHFCWGQFGQIAATALAITPAAAMLVLIIIALFPHHS